MTGDFTLDPTLVDFLNVLREYKNQHLSVMDCRLRLVAAMTRMSTAGMDTLALIDAERVPSAVAEKRKHEAEAARTHVLQFSLPDVQAIQRAVNKALNHPVPWSVVRAHSENQTLIRAPVMPVDYDKAVSAVSERVRLPQGYLLEVAVEEQEHGLWAHFALSGNNALPEDTFAIFAVLKAAGISLAATMSQWTENSETRRTVNVLVLIGPRKKATAPA